MAKPLGNPHQHYLKTQIETASQPQLLVMLFDASVKKLHLARKSIEEKAIEKAHNELIKVQKIFTELMVALDFEVGGDLAHQLFRIYDFVYHRLVQANIKQDVTIIDEVLPIVDNLRGAWTQAVGQFVKEQDGVPLPKAGERKMSDLAGTINLSAGSAAPSAARPVPGSAASPYTKPAAPVTPPPARPVAPPVAPAATRPAAPVAPPVAPVTPQPARRPSPYSQPAQPAAGDQPRRSLNIRG